MTPDEERVKDYLENRELTAERFSKAETRAGKTPDFRVSQNGEFLFYCEVKSSSENRWLDNQLTNAAPGDIVGGARNDPIYNRLTSDIHNSMKQFDAVNKDHKFPNVLALVNHDDMCGFNDLLGILTGNFYANDGTAHPIYRQFSHGRIKEEKGKIHLFIWIDDHKPNRLLFSQTDETHHSALCNAFGVQPNEIKQIGS
ncbi:hypothetical protein [Rhabdochromatium marinum]|uniref:hypothetical protein n=1 Tax=Rhabdochromatium marinum TaxID=48729 RepID=UPI0019082606|nr:hypothetical protein [Rhabdochromatium marinum]MBK1650540.1 hypothetical protein [Rhabdochromatium marinum]